MLTLQTVKSELLYRIMLNFLFSDQLFLFPFFFCMQYLLAFAPFQLRDSKNNPLPREAYDVEAGASIYKNYVRGDEDLLRANLVNFSFQYS